jgi:hypothetical protein
VALAAYGPSRPVSVASAAFERLDAFASVRAYGGGGEGGGASASALQAAGKIAFASERDGGQLDIFVMEADGSGQTNVSNNPALDDDPAFSPDGSRIVFASERDGNEEIYVMNADGTSPVRLTNDGGYDYAPSFSPDGGRIVFTADRDGNEEIYVMSADGSGQVNLTNRAGHDRYPSFSPDGSKIVFESTRDGGDGEVYVMNADGTNQTRLTANGGFQPSFSPEGAKIAFTTDNNGMGSAVALMNADGTSQAFLTNNAGSSDTDPFFSPDGTQIAFKSNRDGDDEIYVMSADGSSQTRLTSVGGADVSPAWQTLLACTPPPAGGVAWYGAEGSASDSLGANNGTLTNGATVAPGFVGLAFQFDGVDDYVEVPHAAALNLTAFTVDAWVYIDPALNAEEFNVLVGKSNTTDAGGGFFLAYDDRVPGFTQALRFRVSDGSGASEAASNKAVTGPGFYHVAGTFDGSTARLYVNGTLVSTGSAISAPAFNTLPLRIGAADGGDLGVDDRLNGRVDEVGIYARALSAAEVKDIYDARSAGKCVPAPSAEMNVTGNGVSIADGDATPSAADHTDFGSTSVNGGTVSRTFTVENTGNADLNLTGTPKVVVSGENASDFTVTVQPSSPVGALNDPATFTVTFDPSGGGTRTATISIDNDDSDENPYDFAVQGTGDSAPVITTASPLSRQRGAAPANSTVAAVGDAETSSDSLTVAATTVPAGITVSNVVNSGGSVTADVAADCTAAAGANTVSLTVMDGAGQTSTANLTVNVTASEINVKGNNTAIADGDATPSAADDTDFGTAPVAGGTVSRTFAVENTGDAGLNLTGTPKVSITGANASDFTVTAEPSSPVASDGPTTFTIQFDPSAAGARSATITVASDDCDEGSFDFAIRGAGNASPSITPVEALARQQGTAASNSVVAMVSDAETAAGSLTVAAKSVPAGLSVSNVVNTNGTVTADVAALCSASTGARPIQFSVTDGDGVTSTANLTVNVTANAAPTLTYANPAAVNFNDSATINPAAGPADNGGVSSIVVQSQGTYAGAISVDGATGAVSVSGATPPGTHTITVRATDNCGATTDATFDLTISAPAVLTVTNTKDSGAGSLRQAILDSNSFAGVQTIQFDIRAGGVQTISPASALPTITQPVVIDATTQPGYAGTPLVELDGTSAGANANGLLIDAAGSTVRGLAVTRFGGAGIFVGGSNNTVGGTGAGEGNVVAFNAKGVVVGASATGVRIQGNSVHSNTALGIDLGDDGVTANDAGDADAGANNLQNFPVVTSATTAAGSTSLAGALASTANATFRVEFFTSPACDASGSGEGQTFLGSANVTTDATGAASFNTTFASATTVGHAVTATATNTATGDTSEFSACRAITNPPSGTVQFDSATYSVNESAGTATVTVTRTGGSFGAVTVSYASAADTATAPADFASAAGTLTFADGDAAPKSFTVAINDDALDEADEPFTVSLSVTSGAATAGAPAQAAVTITDDDAAPSLSAGDVTISEGNSGQSSAVFRISLSAASGLPVSFSYATADGTATAASGDYAAQSGTATIPPGATSINVSVPVNGDTTFESDESFSLDLTSPADATVADGRGQAIITNDDAAPTYSITGAVTDSANSQPLAGVAVALSGASSASTRTDAAGNYSFPSLAAGASYTVTPSLANYTFAPQSRTFDSLSADQSGDFTATIDAFTISGRVADPADAPLAGATVTLGGATSRTTQTDAQGNYSFASVPAGGGYTVTTALAGYAFTPPSLAFADLNANAAANFTARISVSTPAGTNVVVTTAAATLTLAQVLSAGTTTVTPADPSASGVPPQGYSFPPGAPSVEITTTAARSGVVTVCVALPAVSDPVVFAGLRLLHGENGLLVDRTSSSDFASRTICARTDSLSPFVVAFAQPATITGRAADPNGGALSGVTVTLSGAQSAQAATDANGNYSFANLPAGRTYTVTASRTNFTFTPPAHTFERVAGTVTGDFTGAGAFSISGRVSSPSLAGVTVTLSGTRSSVATVGPNGDFVFDKLPRGGTYKVKPQGEALSFTPSEREFADLLSDARADFEAAPVADPTPTPPVRDDFSGGERDPAKFTTGSLTQPAGSTDPLVTVRQVEGQLVIEPRPNFTGQSFNGYVTVAALDFTNATASIEVDQIASGGAQTTFSVGKDDQNFYRFLAQEIVTDVAAASARKAGSAAPRTAGALSQLLLQIRQAGVFNSLSIPYDPVAHRFWRFRHDAAASPVPAMLFEVSPTGQDGTWTAVRVVPVAGGVGALATEISVGTTTAIADPGKAVFDNLNLVPDQTVRRAGEYRLTSESLTVAEGAGSFAVRVARSGGSLGESTVELASEPYDGRVGCSAADGKARARCDYSTTFARLRFAPGETEKAITVFVTDDAYVEGAETFRIALGNPSAGYSVGSPVVAVTIVDNDQPGAQNPVDSAEFFVRQQYLDFLSREPDAGGFAAWTGLLRACAFEGHFGPGKSGSDPECDRLTVSSGFFRSDEFHARGFFAYRFYEVALGRRPTYAEFLSDMQRLAGPQSPGELEANKAVFVREFVSRLEAAGQPPLAEPNGGLDKVAQLDRMLERAGLVLANRDQLAADLAAGRMTSAEVLRAVAESNEASAKFYNRAFVSMQYFGYLQRDPDESGFSAWVNVLNTSGDYRAMIFGFIYSREYQTRFGPVQ